MFSNWVEASQNLMQDKEYCRLWRGLRRIGMEPWQWEETLRFQPPKPSQSERPFVDEVYAALRNPVNAMANSFSQYYFLTSHEQSVVGDATIPILRISILLSTPDMLRKLRQIRRPEVYPTIWNLLLVDTYKFMLMHPLYDLMPRIQGCYREFELTEDSKFRSKFEFEWGEAMRHKDLYYGFLIHPRFSVLDIVRYLRLRGGKPAVRYQASDYLTHMCKERPCVLEALTPLFKEKAFRRRLKFAYEPLIESSIKKVLTRTRANGKHQTIGYEEQVRATVEQAFDELLSDFDFYFKDRPAGLKINRWMGDLDGLPKEVNEWVIEASQLLTAPPISWDREIAFTHYIEQRLGSLVRKLTGGIQSPRERSSARRTYSLSSVGEGLEGKQTDTDAEDRHVSDQYHLADTAREQEQVRVSRKRGVEDKMPEEIIGPDGTAYVMVNQMAERASDSAGRLVTPYQLRQWAKTGLVSAVRRSHVFGRKYSTRDDYWLFEPSEGVLNQIAEISKSMIGIPTDMISRTHLSQILLDNGRPGTAKTLSRYEKKGLLTPVRVGGNTCYSVEEATRLIQQPPARAGRPRGKQASA